MAHPSTDKATDQRIVDLYLSGLSLDTVGQITSTSRIIATRVLRSLNIPIRSSAPPRPYHIFSQAFDTLDGEHEAYWLGFLYADGTVRRTCLNVALAIKDFDHLEKLASFLGCEDQTKVTAQNTARLQVSDRHLADRLRDLGIEPNRPRATRALECVPLAMQHHFLRGCFDGDGSALVKPQLMIVGRLPFLSAMQDILIEHASANPVTIKNEHDTWGKLYYKGVYRCRAITDYLYRDATVYLERKRERVDDWPLPQRGKQSRFWRG